MNDKIIHVELGGQEYPMCFNLNVMEEIQEEYGTLQKWAEIVDGDGEPMVKDLKIGLMAMINEGIDIENDDLEVKRDFITSKKLGRYLNNSGVRDILENIKRLTIDSVSTGEESKNE